MNLTTTAIASPPSTSVLPDAVASQAGVSRTLTRRLSSSQASFLVKARHAVAAMRAGGRGALIARAVGSILRKATQTVRTRRVKVKSSAPPWPSSGIGLGGWVKGSVFELLSWRCPLMARCRGEKGNRSRDGCSGGSNSSGSMGRLKWSVSRYKQLFFKTKHCCRRVWFLFLLQENALPY